MAKILNQKTKLNKEYIFTFGKHKSHDLGYVANYEPCYVLWANENISWFKVEQDIIDECEMECADFNQNEDEYFEELDFHGDQ